MNSATIQIKIDFIMGNKHFEFKPSKHRASKHSGSRNRNQVRNKRLAKMQKIARRCNRREG